MTFTEWSNAKKKKREEESPRSSAATETPSASGTSGSGGSKGSFAEWSNAKRQKRATESAEGWATEAKMLLEETQQYFGSWRSKDDEGYSSISDRNSSLLAQADSWRKQYTGNDEALSYIDEVVAALSEARENSRGYFDYYSQWETEDKYNEYLAYQKNYDEKSKYDLNAGQKEIEALKAELQGLKKTDPAARTYVNDRPYAAGQTSPASGYTTGDTMVNGRPYAAGQQAQEQREVDPNAARIRELEKQISQKERYLNQAKHIQEGITLAGVVNNADFKANSGYISTYDDSTWSKMISKYGMGYEDLTYEYINNQNGIRDEIESKSTLYGYETSASESPMKKKGYDLLKENEIAIYNYYYAKEGKEKAQEYLDNIQETLNLRKATGMFEVMEDNTALELAFGVAAGLDQFKSGMKNAFNFKDDYIAQTAYQMASGMVREDLADNGFNFWYNFKDKEWQGTVLGSSVGQVAYDTITTSANMAPSILTSMAIGIVNPTAGAAIGNALMGVSAAGNAYQEALNEGFSKDQARGYSILVGGSEMVMEKVLGGISAFGGNALGKTLTKNISNADTALKMIAKRLGGSMISEFSEEYLQEVLDPVFRNIMLNTDEDVKIFSAEALYSGILGALSAGFMEGPSVIGSEVKNYSTGKKLQAADISAERLAEIGKTFSADTVAYQLAGKVDENTGAYTMGRLFNEIGATLTEQNVNDIANALVEKGRGEITAKKNAEILAYVVAGGQFTDTQAAIIEADDVLAEVVRTTLIDANSTVNQRTNGYNEALMALAKEKASPKTAETGAAEAGKEITTASDTEDAQKENGAEDLSEVDTSPAKVGSITAIKNRMATIKLEDGSEVSTRDADLSPDDGVRIETIAKIGGISVADANAVLGILRTATGASAQMDSLGATEAYNYGRYGFSKEHMDKNGVFAKSLTEDQRQAIYEIGQRARQQQVADKQSEIEKSVKEAQAVLAQESAEGTERRDRKYMAVLDDGITALSLNESQKAAYRLADQVAEAAKVNIRVYLGKTGEHGYYNPSTDEIYLNLNATNKSRKSMMAFTLGHELVHRAKKGSPAKYEAFANFLIEQYGKQGSSVEAMIAEELAAAKEFCIEMSYEKALEEVVCNACQRMLLDTDAGQKLAEFGAQSKQNKSFLEDLKRWIMDFMDKLRSIFHDVEPDSMAAKEFAKFDESVKQILADMYVEMTIDAGENLSTIQNAFGKDTVVETNEHGEFTMASSKDGSEKLFNLVTWNNGGRETLEATLLREGYTEDEVNAALTIMDEKQKLVEKIAKEVDENGNLAFPEQGRINKATLTTDLKDGHSVLSALVSNGDYPVNIDLLMVCKKRKAYQRVINRLCETGLIQQATVDALAIAEINKILGKYGFETACLGCFVESRRLRIQEWAQTICQEWNAEVKKRNPNAKAFGFGKGEATLTPDEVMKLIGELESGGEKNDKGNLNLGQGSAVKRMGVLMDKVPSLQRTLSIEDLITPDGLTSLRSFDSNLFSMVKSRYGSNSPKFVQEFNPYNHELAKYGKVPTQYESLREYLYAIGGARMQSFSDFIIENWFDYCQIVADLAARKLPMHTYTKEIALAKLFGLTGIKINMSLIPDVDRSLSKEFAGLTRNAKGELELIWADKDRFKATGGKSYMQSINFADAIALQSDPRYSANVGTIAVGISDKHIEIMLDDARIRMIIPYHSSGMNPIFADLMGTSYYKDYTNFQNTTIKQIYNSKGQKVTLKLDKTQTGNLTSGFQFNEVLQDLGDARAAAEAYKEWCADASKHTITIKGETYTAELTPKFNDFSGHQNYYKLLEDFNAYDCISEEAARQGDVQQIYPEDFDKILKDELKAQEKHRQKQEANQAFDKAMGEIESYLKNHSKADTVYYANQHGIKLGAKDKKLNATEKEKLKKLQAEGASFSLPRSEPAPTFYSQMGKVVEGMKQEKFGASSVISMLRGRGVKAEEIRWSGIQAFLDGKKSVTKAELMEFIQGSMLHIEEEENAGGAQITLEPAYVTWDGESNDIRVMRGGEEFDTLEWDEYNHEFTSSELGYVFSDEDEALEYYTSKYGGGGTRWGTYKLDGGKNYRELVFKMPGSTYTNRAMQAHWGDDAEGVLAHARMQDFEVDGKKMLFIEEIQSDWHNEGQRSGYGDSLPEAEKNRIKEDAMKKFVDSDPGKQIVQKTIRHYELNSEAEARKVLMEDPANIGAEFIALYPFWMNEERTQAIIDLQDQFDKVDRKKAPDAPFKGNYHEYVLKRLIRMAAEEGYDSMGWTTADIQSKRWSDEYAEGYRIEYDQDIPKFLKKYGKQWGAEVGKTTLNRGNNEEHSLQVKHLRMDIASWSRDLAQAESDSERAFLQHQIDYLKKELDSIIMSGSEVWSMDITPAMKKSVLEEGQAMYSLPRARNFSYQELTAKPDLQGKVIVNSQQVKMTSTGLVDEEWLVDLIKNKCASIRTKAPEPKFYVQVPDIERNVEITQKGIHHALIRNKLNHSGKVPDAVLVNARAMINLPEILANSIEVNRSQRGANIDVPFTRVMMGVTGIENASGIDEYYAVRIMVEERANQDPILVEANVLGKLYAVNAKKISNPHAQVTTKGVALTTDRLFSYSVADVLNDVKTVFDNTFSADVYQNLNTSRKADDFSSHLLHKLPVGEDTSPRALLANAFETVLTNPIEKQKLQDYKKNVAMLNEEEAKLRDLREQIKELSFAKGPKDTKKIRSLQFEANQAANRINTLDKMLLRFEASAPLQKVLNREKELAYKRAEKKSKETLEAYRERAAKTQRELMDRWEESRKRGIENREKTAMRNKIQRVVGELNQLLLSNDKKRHVPDSLKKAVADALALVNMDTVGAVERAAKYAALIAKETDPDKIDAYTVTMENILRQGEKMGQRLKDLRDAYEEIQDSDDPDIANAYDPVIAGSLKELAGSIGNTSLRNMTIEQLSDVYDMYQMVLTRVRDANKAFLNDKKEAISNLASRVVGEVRRVGGEHKMRVSMLDPVRKFLWNNLKPVYAFAHIGSDTLTEAYNAVRKGEDVWAKDVSEAREYYLAKSKKYGYDSWDFKKKYRFESTSGQMFELTLDQILSLYAYSKREQAHDHLRLGGFVFDSNIETYKEKDSKSGKSILKYKVNTADAHQISTDNLAHIISQLSSEQMAFVDEMQDYLSTVMGAKGNEITMKMYGVKLFKEKFYFPLKSAKQFMFEQNEVSGEVKIKNSGFTNKVVAKANNPVILSNFMDVWSGHVNDMSMYHSFVLPLEDFNRIFNYNSPKQEGQPPVSVKGTIQNAYSPAAVSYVKQLITDLNGGARSDPATGPINWLMGKFKKGSVFASLSVVVQQPSAIARAAALVDVKYFIGPKVDHKRHKVLWEEVKKYAPVAIIKEMGYFDTNMGKSTQDFIQGKEYSSFKEKMKALVVDSNYRDELLSKAPALADEIAWCSIWEAVKRETKAQYPGLDAKSEPFLMLAGSRFTEVIAKTQVYDSILSRSANMRSKDTGMKMATAFMAEPTTSINMVADALLQSKRGDKKYARTAIGAVVASQIFNSILVSFVYAGRDDDEDETYWEKYIGTLTGEVLDSLNPAGYIPFIKDIVSIVQGYDVERSDMAVISDLWNAAKNLKSDKVSVYRKVEGFAGSIAQIFGLPVKNIMRDARGIYQTVMSFVNGQQTTGAGIGYAVKASIPKWMGGGDVSDQNQLYEAMISGDKAQIARVKGRYKDQNAINTAIRKALRENDPRIREAAIAWNANDLDEYMRIAKQIIAEKHFVQDDVVMAIRAEANDLLPDDGETSTSKAKGLFTAEKFAEAISQGDQAMANAIKSDIIQTAQKNGKTANEAEKSFNSSAKTELKEMLLDGAINKQKAISALVTYCGYEQEEAELLIKSYEWEAQGYEGATAAAVRDYEEFCAAVSVPKDTYLYIRSFANNTENDVDENGKTVNYSAMKKIMAEIDAQRGLTAAQKTAIARSLGWAEKNIQKYKTW